MLRMKNVVFMALIFVLVLSAQADGVKNVIFLIGDGMGIPQVTLTRVVNEGMLYMDNMKYAGLSTTHSSTNNITDSAAAGTALACGVKTYNGAIGMDENKKSVKTVLEAAQELGKKTGLISTARVTHATPGAFSAHVVQRYMEREIAEQQLKLGVDVMLGGGYSKYKEQIQNAKDLGYDYITTRDELVKTRAKKVLGLFTDSYMNYDLDRTIDEPSIALMTRKAIDLLENDDKGFFLMVEGGRIDHASHSNDPIGTVYDTIAFDKAIKEALDYARRNKDTLVVVTADHSTGGLTLGKKKYAYYPEVFKGFKHTPDYLISLLDKDFSDLKDKLAQYTSFDWKEEDYAKIMTQKDCKRPSGYSLGGLATYEFVKMINKKAMVSWTTNDHEGSMVMVLSDGPYAEIFSGMYDNTDIPKKIAEAMGTDL